MQVVTHSVSGCIEPLQSLASGSVEAVPYQTCQRGSLLRDETRFFWLYILGPGLSDRHSRDFDDLRSSLARPSSCFRASSFPNHATAETKRGPAGKGNHDPGSTSYGERRPAGRLELCRLRSLPPCRPRRRLAELPDTCCRLRPMSASLLPMRRALVLRYPHPAA